MLTGETFLREGLIDQDQLNQALKLQSDVDSDEPIARVLVKMGLITERDRVRILGKVWGVPFVDLQKFSPCLDAVKLLTPGLAKKYRALPLERVENRLAVAMANPMDVFAIDELRVHSQLEIEPVIALEEDLIAGITKHYNVDLSTSEDLENVIKDVTGDTLQITEAVDDDVSEAELREMGEDAPIIRLANMIVSQAIGDSASDIHVEPMKDGVRVRYRVDGVMSEVMKLPRKVLAPLTSRFKIMSDMDIAEKRVPQDNRISAVVNGKEFDFRVSTLPMIHGEKIVLRVLDKGGINVGLEKLGFLGHNLDMLEQMFSRTFGIILVTGPTGSGKSTTLYSILNRINTGENNIITIEDPVEYELGGINQCGVNVRAGMTFAAGLRAMLRQDPDVIMVGEMRDTETATIAMEAALTGHLVLSTLHTNDAPSAPSRLIDMEVEPFLISSSIIGVLAQRLVRKICPRCAAEVETTWDELRRSGLPIPRDVEGETDGPLKLMQGQGCDHCKGTGYKGRTGIHELMMMNDEIRDEILKKSPPHIIRKFAEAQQMRSLQEDAVMKVLHGVTTIEEVLRVIYS